MTSSYQSVILVKRPADNIVPGETFAVKDEGPIPSAHDLEDGSVLFRTHYLSLDPGMRDWLNDDKSYMPPVGLGEVMRGFAGGTVQASRNDKFPVGSYVTGLVGWTEYKICQGDDLQKVEVTTSRGLVDALSAFGEPLLDAIPDRFTYTAISNTVACLVGFTSLTAYIGIIDVAKVKAGDVVVVSGAAGAVGSIAGQIAIIQGATVIGVAGSEEKCRWLKEELGFHQALNYKDPDFAKKFESATPDLIDVFYDNVGGEVLELALSRAKPFSRFAICGGISQVNTTKPVGPSNFMRIVYMRINVQGFLVFDHAKEFPRALKDLSQWVSEGKIKTKETIIRGSIEEAPNALRDVYRGVNTGKFLLEVCTPTEQAS
ncbi:hypothetical protein LTR10_013343 [Elasticomyces elasticus]|uniref:Enoyl reductase (ER) domain-containing protein n=1 Tax=Exophiala sideris TaxID=1016849 RepID=A0ABR0J6K3_9EURO|nr:hypothetical protein LTR10_013343 [Elasticomyces elasticus]KAK5027428.1 hypothetical protein LTS07_007030 [Exophiala sideris]KAK5034870.1 hypothetical protein LTR13_006052 [Exophiala sideris]KAK5056396.1 hypothetical protein LTR69_007937 [Exophiala sideris]KAK5181115.1 hypothetical protein LTR44_006446 [Eurotiomycetes sp. CCFEE 6388]